MADEPLELRGDGSIVLDIDGKPLTLRAPKLGEYRRLRNGILEWLTWQGDMLAELRDSEGDDAQVGSERRDEIERRQIVLLAEVFETLGDQTLPEPDDWPAWVLNRSLPVTLITHWREIPLARGQDGRSTPGTGVNLGTLPPAP